MVIYDINVYLVKSFKNMVIHYNENLHAAAPATTQPVSVAAENSSLLVTLRVTVAVPGSVPSVAL